MSAVLEVFRFDLVWRYLPALLDGLATNLLLTLLGFLAGGVVLGTLLALANLSTARIIRAEVAERAAALTAKGRQPGLAVILVGDDPASQVYVSHKVKDCEGSGVRSVLEKYPATMTEGDLLARIDALNKDDSIHGILVQMPLPRHIDPQKVIAAIATTKDVDGFSVLSAGELATLDLDRVDWIVLSACDSGRGPVDRNEGVFGMRRAIRYARDGQLLLGVAITGCVVVAVSPTSWKHQLLWVLLAAVGRVGKNASARFVWPVAVVLVMTLPAKMMVPNVGVLHPVRDNVVLLAALASALVVPFLSRTSPYYRHPVPTVYAPKTQTRFSWAPLLRRVATRPNLLLELLLIRVTYAAYQRTRLEAAGSRAVAEEHARLLWGADLRGVLLQEEAKLIF